MLERVLEASRRTVRDLSQEACFDLGVGALRDLPPHAAVGIAEGIARAQGLVIGHRHTVARVDFAACDAWSPLSRALTVEADLVMRAVAEGLVAGLPAAAQHVGGARCLRLAFVPIDRLTVLEHGSARRESETTGGEIGPVLRNSDAGKQFRRAMRGRVNAHIALYLGTRSRFYSPETMLVGRVQRIAP